MKGLKIAVCCLGFLTTIVSCSNNDVFDAVETAKNSNPLGLTTTDNFDWTNIQKVALTVKVDDSYNSEYTYGVQVYDQNPVTNPKANLLAQGTATAASKFFANVEVGKGNSCFYVRQTTPTGVKTVRAVELTDSVLTVDFAEKSAAVSYAKAVTRSTSAKGITWPSAPATTDYVTTAPSGLLNAEKYSGNAGSFIINASNNKVNVWGTNSKLYVEGNVTLDSYYAGQNTTLYITKGATLTVGDLSLSQANTVIYIAKDATFKCTGKLEIGNQVTVYNAGTMLVNTLVVSSTGTLYNQGTVTTTTKTSVENNNSFIVNDGTINTVDFETAGSGKILNTGSMLVSGLTFLSSNSNTWQNNGYWKTTNYTYYAGSTNVINNCKLIVDNKLDIELSDGNGTLLVDGDGSVVTKDLYMNVGQVDMLAGSLFKVTGTATFGYNKKNRGFQGTGSSNALLIMNKAVAATAGQGYTITYGGNLVVACPDHFANGFSGKYPYINMEGAATMVSDTTKTGVEIPTTACNVGHTDIVTPPSDVNFRYEVKYSAIYAMEDNWPSFGDYDMNDVVVKLDITAYANGTAASETEAKASVIPLTNADIKATFMATGASYDLGAYVQFDNVNASNATGTALESGQDKAVILLTKNVATLMGGKYVNVDNTRSESNYQVVNTSLTFAKGISMSDLKSENVNFFITVNDNNSSSSRKEVHLKGFKMTSKGKAYSSDILSATDQYMTADNFVWGICMPGSAAYVWPNENINIKSVNKSFVDWVTSGGAKGTYWYNGDATSKITIEE